MLAYNNSDSLRASIRSVFLPSFIQVLRPELHTRTSCAWGFSRSYNQAAQVPSSQVYRHSFTLLQLTGDSDALPPLKLVLVGFGSDFLGRISQQIRIRKEGVSHASYT